MLQIKPLYDTFKYPTKGHRGDAGWDVYSREIIDLQPGQRHRFKLGFAIIGEEGKVYKVEGKSGLAVDHGIATLGNIIDNGYRGEVSATLVNLGNHVLSINEGDKIAQILVQPVDDDDILETYLGELEETERGDNGFGSTGK